jgi:L-ascorbate metabolism protein UlaG (beta-lactamase superfamily)
MRSVAVATAVAMVASGTASGCCAFGAPRYRGPNSAHFDGEKFLNQGDRVEINGLLPFLGFLAQRKQNPWRPYREEPPGPPPPRRVGAGELRVTFVNHATVLVQMDGVNVLTDPVWSRRVGPVSWAGPERRRPPGIRFEDLPPIDVVVISHNHYDHLDVPTLRRLQQAHRPRFVVGLGAGGVLREGGVTREPIELDWWDSREISPAVRLHAVPAAHFSSRGLCDENRNLWAGYVLKSASGAVYFAGDTGMGPHFAQVRDRFGPVRLAILPIGAYLPHWYMSPVHISPKEAVIAHITLQARTSLAMHHGTFALGDDGEDDPPRDLQRALAEIRPRRDRFWLLGFGEGRPVPPLD